MLRVRGIGLALVAASVMGIVAVSAASAAPEFKPSTKKSFASNGGAATLEASAGEKISCAENFSAGEVTGATTLGKVTVTFAGCEGRENEGKECSVNSKSPKGGTGEIIMRTAKGELGEVGKSEATSGDGVLFRPESGTTFVEIEDTEKCLTEAPIEGDVAGEITQLNATEKSTGKINFIGSAGKEQIKKITVKGKSEEPSLKAFGLLGASLNASQETVAGGIGSLVYLALENPYKIIKNTETKEVKVRFDAWVGESGELSVKIPNNEFEEVAGSTCNKPAGLADQETCNIKIKCKATTGTKTKITVESDEWLVSNAKANFECV